MASKIKMAVSKIEGQGVDIERVITALRNLKADLQGQGHRVSIRVEGVELETLSGAGNETRTRDILLGKNSVR